MMLLRTKWMRVALPFSCALAFAACGSGDAHANHNGSDCRDGYSYNRLSGRCEPLGGGGSGSGGGGPQAPSLGDGADAGSGGQQAGDDAGQLATRDAGSSQDTGVTRDAAAPDTSSGGGTADVGVHDSGSTQPPPDPANGNTSCVSGSHWQGYSGQTMRPGESCASCHGGSFSVAGTVYSQYGEESDCDGFSGATVEIIGANGQSHTFRTNSAGNFVGSAWSDSISMPYTAKVHYQGLTREMLTPQSNGDCNSCHTRQGRSGAPGRIVIPYN